MNFVMLIYVHSGTGYSKMNVGADVPNETRRGGFNGFSIGRLRLDNNGQDLLDAMNRKIDELKERRLIETEYEINTADSSHARISGNNLLPYLDSVTLDRRFDVNVYDDTIDINVYLDKTTDAQVRKKGGRNNRKNRTLKKVRKYYARRGSTKLKSF